MSNMDVDHWESLRRSTNHGVLQGVKEGPESTSFIAAMLSLPEKEKQKLIDLLKAPPMSAEDIQQVMPESVDDVYRARIRRLYATLYDKSKTIVRLKAEVDYLKAKLTAYQEQEQENT